MIIGINDTEGFLDLHVSSPTTKFTSTTFKGEEFVTKSGILAFWQEAVDHLQDVFCELVEAECNKLLG